MNDKEIMEFYHHWYRMTGSGRRTMELHNGEWMFVWEVKVGGKPFYYDFKPYIPTLLELGAERMAYEMWRQQHQFLNYHMKQVLKVDA